MNTYQIKTTEWQSQLDNVSRKLESRKLDIDIIGMDIGSQHEANAIVFKGMAYDPVSDVVEISSEDFEHRIYSPSAIYLTEEQEHIKSIEIIDGEDRRQIITFADQLLLS